MVEQPVRCRRPHQAKQTRATHHLKRGATKNCIEALGRLRKIAPRLRDPPRIRQRLCTDGERWPGDRPRTEQRRKPRRQLRIEQRKAEPKSGKTEKFAE